MSEATGAPRDVHFTLPARAENVAIVRHAISGLAAALSMEGRAIADLKTVVTEACMNVVVHAYENGGPLEVRAWPDNADLAVSVRDYGVGIRPRAEPEHQSLRLGLSLIAALTESFGISSKPGEGTEVVMRVPLAAVENGRSGRRSVEEVDGTQVRLPAGELVAPILSRVIAMYAARADFSVDRLSDAILLSDAIAFQEADEFPDRTAQVAITEHEKAFTVRLGPLHAGGGERLLERMRIPELGASLEGLANEISIERGDGGEFVAITVASSGGQEP